MSEQQTQSVSATVVQPLEYAVERDNVLLPFIRGAGIVAAVYGSLRLVGAVTQVGYAFAVRYLFFGQMSIQLGLMLQGLVGLSSLLLVVSGLALARLSAAWRARALGAVLTLVVLDLIDGTWQTIDEGPLNAGMRACYVFLGLLLPLSLAWFFKRREVRQALSPAQSSMRGGN